MGGGGVGGHGFDAISSRQLRAPHGGVAPVYPRPTQRKGVLRVARKMGAARCGCSAKAPPSHDGNRFRPQTVYLLLLWHLPPGYNVMRMPAREVQHKEYSSGLWHHDRCRPPLHLPVHLLSAFHLLSTRQPRPSTHILTLSSSPSTTLLSHTPHTLHSCPSRPTFHTRLSAFHPAFHPPLRRFLYPSSTHVAHM